MVVDMLFRSQTFPTQSQKIACLVCGLSGKINQYRKAVKALNQAGYSVVVYEYDLDIFAAGDPSLLPALIQQITDDFAKHSASHKEVLATGVSLGAYIAFNVQRRNAKIKRGLYGTAGISVAHAIFTARVFRSFRRKFEAHGYTERSLRTAWQDIEILEDLEFEPEKSIVIVMGGLDRIVRYKTASRMMDAWRRRGIQAEYFPKKGLGHGTTIWWYKNHLGDLLRKYAGTS
jgi:hypothetical protein